MNNNNYNLNTFYILSGVSASGKSTLTDQLLSAGWPKEGIVSTDKLREQILGSYLDLDENGVKETLYGWDLEGNRLFNMVETIIDMRLKQKLPTLIDATNLTDNDRGRFVKIAEKNGVYAEVVIFDVPYENLKVRLANRIQRFDNSILEKQIKVFQKESIYPYRIFQNNRIQLIDNNIVTTKLDIVGDTHGLLTEFLDFANKLGWNLDKDTNSLIHLDKERKLVFLGDIVDRGLQSIELLQVVKNTVDKNNAILILGNHEEKLINNYENWVSNKKINGKSLSSSETFANFLRLPQDNQEELYKFLKYSPAKISLVINKETKQVEPITYFNKENCFNIAFAHANNVNYNPITTPKSYALYGSKAEPHGADTDLKYQENYLEKINKFTLIRGHIPNTSQNNNVYSLDDRQAFEGYLAILKLDDYIEKLNQNNWNSSFEIFESVTTKYKTNFNYDKLIKSKVEYLNLIIDLEKNGILIKEIIETSLSDLGYKLYKKSNKSYFLENQNINEDAILIDFVGNKSLVVKDLDLINNNTAKNIYFTDEIDKDNIMYISKNNISNNFLSYHHNKLEINMNFSTDFKNSLFKIFNHNNITLVIDSKQEKIITGIDNKTGDFVSVRNIKEISDSNIIPLKFFDKKDYDENKSYHFFNENYSFNYSLESKGEFLEKKSSLNSNKEIQKILQITQQFLNEKNIEVENLEDILLHKKFASLSFLEKKSVIIESVKNHLENDKLDSYTDKIKLKF